MGEKQGLLSPHETDLTGFMKALLDDVQALERMLDADMIESGISRIGAEQEMFLVDSSMFPAHIATDMLKNLNDPRYTTELATFNLEANLTPKEFKGACLSEMEAELDTLVLNARAAAGALNSDVLLTGILPTLQKTHFTLDAMTPNPRYKQMNEALTRVREGHFQVSIKGMDELEITHDNMMLEACNTSFQVHFQVSPQNFANCYNIAQTIAAPVLAASVNSPFLMGKRLWQETRLALYQSSVDTRSTTHQRRGQKPRVHFGDRWVKDSVLELFRSDIARFKLLLARELGENSLDLLDSGKIPPLSALCLHNSTIWRWNRPCYGLVNGRPHLRIETRYIPSGPSIADEMANAAFYFGLMRAFDNEYDDIKSEMAFENVRENFFKAAGHGLSAQFQWLDGKTYQAQDLILKRLLPIAKEGLQDAGIRKADISRYLKIMKDRVKSGVTGAQWQLKSFAQLGAELNTDIRCRSVTEALLKNQKQGQPVHTWDSPEVDDTSRWHHSFKTVEQFMKTDLFTVAPDDIIDLAANIMDWEQIRHVPVEDHHGQLLGIVSNRMLFRILASQKAKPVQVREVMKTEVITVAPDTSSREALGLMRDHQIGCLPVVDDTGKLVGLVTEHDFVTLAIKLLDEIL